MEHFACKGVKIAREIPEKCVLGLSRRDKTYIVGPGLMTKMAAMPEYGKNLQNTRNLMILKLGMEHYGLKLYKVYINNGPGLTLTYFTNLVSWGKLLESHAMENSWQQMTILTK